MKHQYIGDTSDYRKYALLQVLAAGGARKSPKRNCRWLKSPPHPARPPSPRGERRSGIAAPSSSPLGVRSTGRGK